MKITNCIPFLASLCISVLPAWAQNAQPRYVGSKACQSCHADVYARWQKTPMANIVRDPREHPDAIIPELPKNVGAKRGPDPRWFGYSVGHWENDNTFVVETNGADDRSWVDGAGHPHSVDMTMEERYTRKDHDTLDLDITLNDPKYYTAPIKGQNHFKWVPDQELDEQLCVPSEGIAYQNIIGIPAGDGSTTKK